jgi:murein DD-endopeptidase MepM/ murein hydrolase activator NlpD
MNSLLDSEELLISPPTRLSSQACPQCAGPVSIDSPHLRIAKGSIQVFCMETCLRDYISPKPPALELEIVELRTAATGPRALFMLGLGFATLSPCLASRIEAPRVEPVMALGDRDAIDLPDVVYGPRLPTEEELEDLRASEFAASLSTVKWVHPLRGPSRRMPLRESRAFGADRPGDRPYECRSGHCGVDLGGEEWGEPILASSDAVVAKVNRDRHRSGGLYVRLSHLDGAVFTQYFHLAAIPKGLRPGKEVRAGDTIGLLGETGVENSGPHLHFTVSVRADPESPEVYIDPEPLIALWPMRHTEQTQAIAGGPPGVPIGATGRYKGRKHKQARASKGMPRMRELKRAPDLGVMTDPPGPAASMPEL